MDVINRIQKLFVDNPSSMRKKNVSIALGRTEIRKLTEEAHFLNRHREVIGFKTFTESTVRVSKVMGYEVIEVDKEWFLGLVVGEEEE